MIYYEQWALHNWQSFIIYPSNDMPFFIFSGSQKKRKFVCPCIGVYAFPYVHVKNEHYTIILMFCSGSNLELCLWRTILYHKSIYQDLQLINTYWWYKQKCLKVVIYFITLGWNHHRIIQLYALHCKINQIMSREYLLFLIVPCASIWIFTKLVLSKYLIFSGSDAQTSLICTFIVCY